MKKTLTALAAGALLSIGGLASAAEPMHLTEAQMDSVAAGAQHSWASSGGVALIGAVATGSDSASYERVTYFSRTRATSASAMTVVEGGLIAAGSRAGAGF